MKNNSTNLQQHQQQQQQQQQDSGCKIFVGGLTWNTTKEMLYNEFAKYGEIVDSIVMKNPETGNSRGFGFVTYKENQSAENAVASGSHKIDGKIVDVKLCNPRLAAQQRNSKQKSDNCKVFVGGLPHGVTDDQIKQFFSRYGMVKEFKMMYDENKQRPRGFGFITFELEESANQVLQEHYIQFNGKQIEVKPQIHNIKQQTSYMSQMGGGGGGPHQQHASHQMQVQHHASSQQQSAHLAQQQHHQQQQQQQYNTNSVNWNQNWNQTPPMPNATNGVWPGAAYANQMANPNSAPLNQQWGYAGSQPLPYANTPNNPNLAQSNWNYNYYGQAPQQTYYQADSSGTGNFYQQHHQQQQQQQSSQLVKQEDEMQLASASFEPQASSSTLPLLPDEPARLISATSYIDASFLKQTNTNYKHSTASSVAGTIGSSMSSGHTTTNYSDSDASSSYCYYRDDSHGSNSSIAPSISSLASSSLISNVSSRSSNTSASSNLTNDSSVSNHNHHHINSSRFNSNNLNSNNNHYHHRGGGSVGSSSATDISSIYSGSVHASEHGSSNSNYNSRQSYHHHSYRR